MPRILGVDVPNEKVAWVALTYIHGIGSVSSKKVLNDLAVNELTRARDLSEDELARIATHIEKNYVVEGQLRRRVAQNITRLKDIGSYRGMRHRRGLPVRGQRTQCNARSRKGPKKTVAGKKIARK